MKYNNRLPLIVLFIIVMLSAVQGQESMEISGKIISSKGAEPGLLVTLNRMAEDSITMLDSTMTSSSGVYRFEVEPDSYLINVTYQGNTFHSMVTAENSTADFDFSGSVNGRVIHADGRPMSDVDVSLISRFNTVCAATRTDGSGYFRFSSVNLAEHSIKADYMYVGYNSGTFAVGRSSPVTANVTVYDSTTDPAGIQVVADHIVIMQDVSGPWVQEFVRFVNMGNMTYYGPEGVYVGVGMPSGIKNLQTDIMDCCKVQEDRRIWADPMEPILPGGSTEVTMSYNLDVKDKEYVFEKDILYPSIYVLVFGDADSGIDLAGQDQPADTENMDGRNYRVLRYAHLNSGDSVLFTITGYTIPGKNNIKSSDLIVYSILGVLIIGLLAYPVISKRGEQRSAGTISGLSRHSDIAGMVAEQYLEDLSKEELEAEKLKIFEALRNLDDQLENDLISEDEYDEMRSEYKDRTVEIIRRIRDQEMENDASPGFKHHFSGIDLSATVKEISSGIQDMDDQALLKAALESEKSGGNRKTLIQALSRRIDELEPEK